MNTIDDRTRKFTLLLLKGLAIVICLISIFDQYFFAIDPFSISPVFVLSLASLFVLNWVTHKKPFEGGFKPLHILLIVTALFWAALLRTGYCWAFNTFPLRDAYTVWINLQEPFDDFAYYMIKRELATTIPQSIAISIVLTVFLCILLNNTRKRMIGVGVYFVATIAFLVKDIPVSDYIHIVMDEPEKNASYSMFFVENYVNPDSVRITPPEQKRNLILIYLESLETTFSDKNMGAIKAPTLSLKLLNWLSKTSTLGKTIKTISAEVLTHSALVLHLEPCTLAL